MSLLKDNQFIEDEYIAIGNDDVLPNNPKKAVLVSPMRYRTQRQSFTDRGGKTGISLSVDDDPNDISAFIKEVDLITLPFASFADGRAYSIARIIRERLKFEGELRAVGDVLPDQYSFMLQVGFDSFEIDQTRHPLKTWHRVLESQNLTYQGEFKRGVDSLTNVFAKRHSAAV